MKITTWNVNGLRAVMKKGFLESVQSIDSDILCLQEVKAKPEQVKEDVRRIEGYEEFWNSADRPGYSGVVTYSKKHPELVKFGLGDGRFDTEGRVVFTRYQDFDLFNIYFPNGQRGQERLDFKLAFYEHLLKICDQLRLEGRSVIIAGDFNTAHREIDLANPKANEVNSGFLPEERAWIDVFLAHHFVDAFRSLYPTRVAYTWWTYRFNARQRGIGWRLDFFLVSEELLPRIIDVQVHSDLIGSDHCPVTLSLSE